MNYGDLIKDAFWISWRNKYLWIFGLFAGGAGGGFNVPSVPSGGGGTDFDDFPSRGSDFSSTIAAQGFSDNVGLIVALVVVVALIALILIALSLISQAALADSVAAIDRGERRGFLPAFRVGVSNIWRVLGYFVLFFLISLGLLLIIGIPTGGAIAGTFIATESVGTRIAVAVVAGLIALGLLIVVFIPLTIVGQYALREIVLRRSRVTASIRGGFGLFRRNIGRSLLVWIIQVAISIGVGIALLVALLLVGLVLFLPTIFLAVAGLNTAAIIAGVVAGVILLPILLAVSGAIGAFNHSYWTLAYVRLSVPPEPRVA